jgi:Domain of unknown function DUF11
MVSARLVTILVSCAIMLVCGVPGAFGASPAPGWSIDSFAELSNFSTTQTTDCLNKGLKECDEYTVTVTNMGSRETDGSPIVLSDILPAGVEITGTHLFWSALSGRERNLADDLGQLCTSNPVRCELPISMAPEETLQLIIDVTVEGSASEGPIANTATVSGGGAPEVTTTSKNAISSNPAEFGFSNFDFHIAGLDGTTDTQAGDHPYEVTTRIELNNEYGKEHSAKSVQDARDIIVDLPLGFVGSTLAAAQCTLNELSGSRCPLDTKIGYIYTEPSTTGSVNSPLYNIVPDRGVPAEFGFTDILKGSHALYASVVPTPTGYVLRVTSREITQIPISDIVVGIYGDPAERDGTGNAQVPFFTNPTDCSGAPLVAKAYMDSWSHPAAFNADGTPNLSDPNWKESESVSPPVTGCNALQFTPELGAQPTTNMADTPSGLEFELTVPQTEVAGTLATPTLKKAVVKLPPGMTVDPSAGDGLAACSTGQIGWVGPGPLNFNPAAPSCPEASKIGSLELTTPLIPGVLTGELYLAAQNENPFNTTLAAYVVVDDPVTGVLIKIAGRFLPDPQTGQLTAVFDENPNLPFSDLKLHFFGGPRAELATPESCGTFTTGSELSPYSLEEPELPSTPFASFTINEACPNGFNPTFTGGSTNLQAGAYTPFVASFARQDTDQELGGLSVSLPPGLLADVGSVPLCGEAQANAGTCPESTQVGTVDADAGPGPNPLSVPGKVYLTGPYNGGPYGLSVVVPAIAGPFQFGLVVVRQSLRIDPSTAAVTDVSDPFPTILQPTGADGQKIGIPIRLRRIDVSIDRPGFTFNPTNCGKLNVGGSITSTQGQTRGLGTPFQVTNCATLKFQPKFAVSTSGKTSKANGASLAVKLTYPKTAQGVEANIARVKVDLPKALPSRLTTLQKACTVAQFNTNPAGCPAASIIGHAKAITPILPVPLEGPAYFVSHGGEAFPSLIMVLQGNGVTLDLVGTTFISKTGITSSTFKTVPDAPVGSFELNLPEGKYSALAANGNLCKIKLAMPTEFLAQNGAKINESTKISVTACPKTKKAKRAKKGPKVKSKK